MSTSFPYVPIAQLTGSSPIVVLAPHPDDESLGCGALLLHAFAHNGAHVVCMTDGSASHPGSSEWTPQRLAECRRSELKTAVSLLGVAAKDFTLLGFPDGRLHEYNARLVAGQIAEVVQGTGATRIFAPALEDHHSDHKATARIASELQEADQDRQIYSYPVWSRWDDSHFMENIARHSPVKIDTRACSLRKRAAIAAHQSQLGKCVKDDPAGFVMDPQFVEKFILEDEIYWRNAPCR